MRLENYKNIFKPYITNHLSSEFIGLFYFDWMDLGMLAAIGDRHETWVEHHGGHKEGSE